MTDPLVLQDRKARMRREMATAIARMTATERADADQDIPHRLREWLAGYTNAPDPAFWSKLTILAFMPLSDEPEITSLLLRCIEHGGTLVLPRVESVTELALCPITDLGADLEIGRYDILEPRAGLPMIDPGEIDVLLVPGRAFNERGDRLGRGKGYYDRLLTSMRAVRIGLAYDCQIVEEVPTDDKDEPVHIIITPSRVLDCRS